MANYGRKLGYLVTTLVLAGICHAATLTVTNTNDSGPGSLRQAILDSNASVGVVDTIVFNIPGSGVHTIRPLSPYGVIDPAVIDATTQPGYAGSPLIEIDGSQLGAVATAFDLEGGCTLKGFAINRVAGSAARAFASGNNTIAANFIGTDVTGTSSAPNQTGILLGSPNNVVSGNLISGNTSAGVEITNVGTSGSSITGNTIGLNVSGTAAIGNGSGIIVHNGAASATIGGKVASARNIISGNIGYGIYLNHASANVIYGNFIGTNSAGDAAVPNGWGVYLDGTGINTNVGGVAPGSGNVISGNTNAGVTITNGSSLSNVQGNLIGTNAAGNAAIPNGTYGVYVSATPYVAIGAYSSPAELPGARNIVSGNGAAGVYIGGAASHNVGVLGNFIGTDVSGTFAIPNFQNGVTVDSAQAFVGSAGLSNVISGNRLSGAAISNSAPGNLVAANFIGTDFTGSTALGNSADGISLSGSSNITIGGTSAGTGNVVAFNGGRGVVISGLSSGDTIEGNSIFSNTGLGIDLGNDGVTPNHVGGPTPGAPNGFENFPVISSAQYSSGNTYITGSLNSAANTTYRLEFFVDPSCDHTGYGQGKTFLGFQNVTTDNNGNSGGNINFPSGNTADGFLTATATDPAGNTSEFSACAVITGTPAIKLAVQQIPPSSPSGTPFNIVVTAQDQFNNTVTGYSGIVHFTSTDCAAILPADSSLNQGAKQFSVTMLTAGLQTVTATDTVQSSITGTSAAINITGKSGPGISLTSSVNPSYFRHNRVTFTATLVGCKGGIPSGTVYFYDGAVLLGSPGLDNTGKASITSTLSSFGTHHITVSYSGDVNFAPEISLPLLQQNTPAPRPVP